MTKQHDKTWLKQYKLFTYSTLPEQLQYCK